MQHDQKNEVSKNAQNLDQAGREGKKRKFSEKKKKKTIGQGISRMTNQTNGYDIHVPTDLM